MRTIGVIPARFASTRFPGKVLAKINSKPMLQYVWERAKKSRMLNEVFIACDDERVALQAEAFGAKIVMTKKTHRSGTDRIAEAVKRINADVVVNIQADEPLITHQVIDSLAKALLNDKNEVMATLIRKIQRNEDLSNPNVVKVVTDQTGHALYFSRSVIPFNRDKIKAIYYKHLGIYAYRKKFLLTLTRIPRSFLERAEQLEQLRVLDAGYKIKTVLTDIDTVGVDTPQDLRKVQNLLNRN